MGCILTCCIDSICGCCNGEEEPCYESDTYEAVAAATSESTTVEPGKLDVGATEGHDLQHISNQKMPTAPVPDLEECDLDIVVAMLPEMMNYTAENSNLCVPDLEECDLDILENKMLPDMMNYTAQNSYCSPEDSLSLKSLSPSEEDNDYAQILPSHVQASPEDNLSLVTLPRSEDYDGGDDDDDYDAAQILPSRVQASPEDNSPRSEDGDCDDDEDEDDDDTQILPSRVQAWPEDRLFLRCSPRYKDEDDDDDADCDDDDDDDVHGTAWKENDLTLESISDEETHPGSSEDNLGLVRPPPSEDDDGDDDDDDDVQILPSRVQAWPEDRLFLRCPPRYKDEDDDDDVHGTAWNENDLTLESISDEETYPG